MWKQGILAEYGSPKKFSSKKKFLAEFRECVAEWFDMDLIASHYAYGNDVLCTLDAASSAGSYSIMHANQAAILASYGIKAVSPAELVNMVP